MNSFREETCASSARLSLCTTASDVFYMFKTCSDVSGPSIKCASGKIDSHSRKPRQKTNRLLDHKLTGADKPGGAQMSMVDAAASVWKQNNSGRRKLVLATRRGAAQQVEVCFAVAMWCGQAFPRNERCSRSPGAKYGREPADADADAGGMAASCGTSRVLR